MPIRLLPPEVAAKIAAGEVVERPASVVKELVENALDAGATLIEVETRGGGVALIRVTDDGCGIPPGELDMAVQRHATSKIAGAEDLQRIGTLGFRGEALAAVAAVARLTLASRPPEEIAGAYLALEGGHVADTGRQGSPVGTTVLVRDLFKTVPARLAFLRSVGAENARSLQVVSHYALAYPEVGFRLLVDGRMAFHSQGNGDPRDVLVEMWGYETASALYEVEEAQAGSTRVRGFAGPPEMARARREAQAIFVNRRWVENRTLSYAITDAYRDLVPRGRHPVAVLFVQVPPEEVDVNVHPAKTEVRFRREGEVFAAIQRALRRTLAAHSLLPIEATPATPLSTVPAPPAGSEVSLEAPPLLAPGEAPSPRGASRARKEETRLVLRPVGQVGTTYIVAEGPEGMYLIDQHAAHERLRFEEVLAARRAGASPTQGLLEPLPLSLTRPQKGALEGLRDLLVAYGFQWEPFGEGSILLRGVPAALREGEAAQTLREALEDTDDRAVVAEEAGEAGPLEDQARRVAATVACHSAVRAGQTLSLAEMDALLRQFEAANFPRLCPHGRPTMVHLSAAQLEKQFGRR